MRKHFTKDELQAGLSYARWLHQKAFRTWLNDKLTEMGQPTEPHPILLNSVGETVFKGIRDEVVARRNKSAGILLAEGERRAVVAEIIGRMNGGK